MEDEDRIATLDDYIDEGQRNGIKAAEMFYQLCFGEGSAKQMEPEMWWRVHLEDVFPASLNGMRSAGASEEEVMAYEKAFSSELERCCMSNAELGFFETQIDPTALYGPVPEYIGTSFNIESLNGHSTLAMCIAVGKLNGKNEARQDALRSQYRGYDFVGDERKKLAHAKVGDLYSLGLSPDQVNAYVEATIEAATEYFANVSQRYAKLST